MTQPNPVPAFDLTKPHVQRPRLRAVRGFPAQVNGPDGNPATMLGLTDARQVSDKMVFTIPAAQLILPLMDGSRTLDEIVTQVGRGLALPTLQQLVAQLDDAGLIEGPVFDAILAKMRADFDAAPVLPPASTAQFAEALIQRKPDGSPDEEPPDDATLAKRLGEIFDAWIGEALKNATDPALSQLPKAVVVPHIDYPRGWINYASAYGRLRVADRPDRVIILGTNHFGQSTGVCGCDKGYQTILGVCPSDPTLIAAMRRRVGDKLFENRFDHEREHSIELQIPWIQHVFGKDEKGEFPMVFGALIHDPALKNGESYDNQGVDLQPFVDALKATIAELPGRTLVVSSADLSHVGPAFGDQQPLAGEEEPATAARNKVFQHDQEMLRLIADNKPWELVAAMAWQQNPTRWCSTGNLVATLLTVEPTEVKLLNYSAAMDEAGSTMVSSTAMIIQ